MIRHRRVAALFVGIFGVVGFVRPAHAYTEGGLQTSGDRPSGHLAGACKDDIQKLCGNVKAGSGAIRDCMKTHESELSPACKDNMAQAKAKREQKKKELMAACQADIKQYCANVTPGHGREIACLKSFDDKISAGCKETLHKPMGMHKGMPHDKGAMDGAPPPAPPGQ